MQPIACGHGKTLAFAVRHTREPGNWAEEGQDTTPRMSSHGIRQLQKSQQQPERQSAQVCP